MTRPRLSAMQRLDLAVMGYADAVTWCEQHPNEGDASLAWSRYRRALRALLVEAAERGMNAVPVRGAKGDTVYRLSLETGRAVYAAVLKGKR